MSSWNLSRPTLGCQCRLKAFGVNASLCPLRPGHLRSLRSVDLDELRFRWATSQSDQASAFRDIGTSHLWPTPLETIALCFGVKGGYTRGTRENGPEQAHAFSVG